MRNGTKKNSKKSAKIYNWFDMDKPTGLHYG